MSLLLMAQDPEFQSLTNEIFSRQLAGDSRLKGELNCRARQKMYQDVQYNVDFLYTALKLGDVNIFERYARWLYQLLTPLMPYCTRERLRDIMVEHYELVRDCMAECIPEEKQSQLHCLLDHAIRATMDECLHSSEEKPVSPKYESEIEQYLDCLLQSNTKGAMTLITEYIKRGIPLSDICVDIIAEAMRRVGELWHSHLISVDMEHYGTSVTQMALAQLYPIIFSQDRKGKKVLVSCVGSELHEMGARMVADLFEYDGWDSIYLGAAVPLEAIQSAVIEQQPLLAALSVTMPQHLPVCREAVAWLRREHPQIKIAVGGNAFAGTDLWKSWEIDIYTKDARELVKWAGEKL